MALIDADNNTYSDMGDYQIQLAQNQSTQQNDAWINRSISLESGWKTGPGNRTGSNVGLGQWGPSERQQYNITDPDDPAQNRDAFMRERANNAAYLKKNYNMELDDKGSYIMHQQGIGGGSAILAAPAGTPMSQVLAPYYSNPKRLEEAVNQRQGASGLHASDPVEKFRDYWGAKFEGQNPARPHIQVTPGSYPQYAHATIDREHDVPLLAAGLMNDEGQVYGTAIDRRIPHYMTLDDGGGKGPVTIDSGQFVHLHEMEEIKDMEKNLLPKGVKSSEAYTQAHNGTATPAEKAAVQSWARSQGRDPDKIWSNYQAFWKEQLGNIEGLTPERVNPHTYLHPYDGHPMQATMETLSGRTIAEHPKESDYQPPVDWDTLKTMPGHKAEKDVPDSGQGKDQTNSGTIKVPEGFNKEFDKNIFKGYPSNKQNDVAIDAYGHPIQNQGMGERESEEDRSFHKRAAIRHLMNEKTPLTRRGSEAYEKQKHGHRLKSRMDNYAYPDFKNFFTEVK